jgi:calcineurin-like phosphoesterase family protein
MRYFTSDLHLAHPFVAATRGFWKPGMRPDRDIIEAPDGINRLRRELSEYRFNEMVDTEAHDRLVIRRINAVCGKNDDLYIAGDLSAGGHKSLRRALYLLDDLTRARELVFARRRGDINDLVLGNHDGFHIRNTNAYDFASVCIGSISDNLFLTLENGMPAIISHTPRRAYIEQDVELEDTAPNSLDKALLKYAPDVPDGIVHLYGHTHGKSPDEFHDGTSINIGLDAWCLRPVSERQITETLTRMQTTDCA